MSCPGLALAEAPTPRQLDVLRFIRGYIASNGYPPTIREIADGIGVASTNGVNDHLLCLEEKGLIQRPRRTSRGFGEVVARAIVITDAGHAALQSSKPEE